MQIKKLLITLIAAIVMVLAFRMGVTGDKLAEKEQFFTKQIYHEEMSSISSHTESISKNIDFDVLRMDVVAIVSVTSVISLLFCILFAKQAGLFFISEKFKKIDKSENADNIDELLGINLLDANHNSKRKIHTVEVADKLEPSTKGIAI